MSMIKSYTDLGQSKKLAEILPLESADMGWYYSRDPQAARNQMWVGTKADNADIPCWSLAALLDVIPEGIIENYYCSNLQKENGKYSIAYGDEELLCIADNPVDACYELILELNELKML